MSVLKPDSRRPNALRVLVLGISAAILLPLAAAAQTEVTRRADARADGLVEISNVAGSITVTGWERNEVEVKGILARGVEGLEVESRGRRVEVKVEHGRRHDYGGSADLEIRVPRGSEVSIETVSASVDLADIAGELDVETVSGDVDVRGRPAAVDVETVSGDIDVDDAVERVAAESVNGTIRLRGGRDIEAGTVSGEIRLDGVESVSSVELEVVSGRVEFVGSLATGAYLTVSSHNGSIDVALPASVSARFEVSSFSGRVDNELGPPARRGRFSPSRELDFTTGSGDARVRIESFSGSITLRKR